MQSPGRAARAGVMDTCSPRAERMAHSLGYRAAVGRGWGSEYELPERARRGGCFGEPQPPLASLRCQPDTRSGQDLREAGSGHWGRLAPWWVGEGTPVAVGLVSRADRCPPTLRAPSSTLRAGCRAGHAAHTQSCPREPGREAGLGVRSVDGAPWTGLRGRAQGLSQVLGRGSLVLRHAGEHWGGEDGKGGCGGK